MVPYCPAIAFLLASVPPSSSTPSPVTERLIFKVAFVSTVTSEAVMLALYQLV